MFSLVGVALVGALSATEIRPIAEIVASPDDGGLDAALQSLRSLRAAGKTGPALIRLEDGVYRLAKPIVLTDGDSGEGVTFRAVNRGKAVITGTVALPELKPLADAYAKTRIPASVQDKVFEADLKAAGITDYGIPWFLDREKKGEGMHLILNGKAATQARWPDDGYTAVIKGYGKNGSDGFFQYGDGRIDNWKDEPDAYAAGFFAHDWFATRTKFKSIDTERRLIRFVGRGSHYGYGASGYWFGYHLLCELDRPGEYYLDRTRGKLFLYPPEDGVKDGELTLADRLFELQKARNVTFDGLVLRGARDRLVSADDSRQLTFVSCAALNSWNGLCFSSCDEVRIVGCDVTDMGASAIWMWDCGDRRTLRRANNLVENCHISRYADRVLACRAAVQADGNCGVTVRQCTIHDAPCVGILFRQSSECTFVNNEIHSILLDSGEMGAFYTAREWTLVGNVLANNYIHDIPWRGTDFRPSALFYDDGGTGMTATNNIVRNVPVGTVVSAMANYTDRNLFYDVPTPFSVWNHWAKPEQWKPMYSNPQSVRYFYTTPFREEPWKSRYPYLALIDDSFRSGKMRAKGTRSSIRGNVVVNAEEPYIKPGWDGHEPTEDTWLVEGNRVLKGISFEEALKTGPYPKLSEVGCQPTKERLTWPVVHPVCGPHTDRSYIQKAKEAAKAFAAAHPDKRFKVLTQENGSVTFAEYRASRYRAEVRFVRGKLCLDEVYTQTLQPMVSSKNFGDKDNSGMVELDGEFVKVESATLNSDTTRVTGTRADGSQAFIDFDDAKIVIRNTKAAFNIKPIYRPEIRRVKDVLIAQCYHKYGKVYTRMACSATPRGFLFAPAYGGITFDFSAKVD